MKNKRMRFSKEKYQREKGITLIALVVTIVVLLILAGITINFLMRGNSVLSEAEDAREQHKIGELKDRITIEIMDYSTEKITKPETEINRLWERLVATGIIKTVNDKEGPDKDENGNDVYTLNTEDGYTVEIIVNENGQVTIGDIAKGALPPVIRRIETSSTNNSIKAKAAVSRLKSGTVEYWCKVSTQDDSEYQKMTNLESGEAEITLTPVEGTTYKIKVFAKKMKQESIQNAQK